MTYLSKEFNEKKVVKRIFALAIILFCIATISALGCKKKVETKEVKAQETAQGTKNNQNKKLPEENISEDITEDISEEGKEKKQVMASTGIIYDPEDRRDPFIPLIVPKVQKDEKKKVVQNAPPLESYDVMEFRLIGIIVSSNNTFHASLVAPDKKSYTVMIGTKIGFHMGEIKDINMNEVIVEEYEEDHHNELQLKERKLTLRRDDS